MIDLIFPTKCIGCKIEDHFLCEKCKKDIQTKTTQHCPQCKKIETNGEFCKHCIYNKKFYFDKLLICTEYLKNGLIQKTIKDFKYKFIQDLNLYFGSIASETLKSQINNLTNYILIPVPLHKKRQNFRGFNQSELIATEIAKNLNMHLINNSLIRTINTTPQAGIKKEERLINLKNAFTVNEKEWILNKNIILIDDISTTGTTLNECAKVLKENGANEIIGLVIARGL